MPIQISYGTYNNMCLEINNLKLLGLLALFCVICSGFNTYRCWEFHKFPMTVFITVTVVYRRGGKLHNERRYLILEQLIRNEDSRFSLKL